MHLFVCFQSKNIHLLSCDVKILDSLVFIRKRTEVTECGARDWRGYKNVRYLSIYIIINAFIFVKFCSVARRANSILNKCHSTQFVKLYKISYEYKSVALPEFLKSNKLSFLCSIQVVEVPDLLVPKVKTEQKSIFYKFIFFKRLLRNLYFILKKTHTLW